MEERGGGGVGSAGGQRRGVRGALGRGEGFDAGLRLEKSFGRERAAGEEAGQGRQDAADRWDGGGAARRGCMVMEVGIKLQTGQLQSGCAEPVGAVREAVQSAGLQVLLLERVEAEMLPLEALPPPQKTPVLEHVRGVGVQSPVVALAGVPGLPGHLYKAVIERQIVSDRVLPGGELLPVINEAVADKVTDLAEGEPLLWTLQYGHGYQSDVRVRRLHRRGTFGFGRGSTRRLRAVGVPVFTVAAGSLRAAVLLAP